MSHYAALFSEFNSEHGGSCSELYSELQNKFLTCPIMLRSSPNSIRSTVDHFVAVNNMIPFSALFSDPVDHALNYIRSCKLNTTLRPSPNLIRTTVDHAPN